VPRASFDPDAARYLAAVEAADGQALETPVRRAVDAFVKELKATPGLFDAIKASCILCGARTLSGALVPLAGTAPTNNNFIPDDYNRETGLVGDGSTKYLNSNRSNDDEPQDDFHLAVYVSTTGSGIPIGMVSSSVFGISSIAFAELTSWPLRSRISAYFTEARGTRSLVGATGFLGTSRTASSSHTSRVSGSNEDVDSVSATPQSGDIGVLARINTQDSTVDNHSDARLAFYSIGEALDLEALDDAVSTLVTAIGAAV
jgi:hypothetical protein